MDPKQFGHFISEERGAKGLTQKELAEKLGVTDKAISKWERGVCLYGMCCAVLFLLFVLYDKIFGMYWLDEQMRRLFRAETPLVPAAWDYFYAPGIRWEPRWLAFWFIMLSYVDIYSSEALVAAGLFYPAAKLLHIRRNERRATCG